MTVKEFVDFALDDLLRLASPWDTNAAVAAIECLGLTEHECALHNLRSHQA